jgi:outer membrane lipoprotein SlyB
VVEKLKQAALDGDVAAARLLIERIVPPVKPAEAPVQLTLPNGTLTEQGRAVLGAIGAGTLAPGQGSVLLTAIGALARLVEIDEIERRLTVLEGRGSGVGADTGSAK